MYVYGKARIGIKNCLWCKHAIIHPADPSVGIFEPYVEDCRAEYLSDKALDLLEEGGFNIEQELPLICGQFSSRELNTTCICGKKIFCGEEYMWQWWGDYGEPLCKKCYDQLWHYMYWL